MIENIKFHFEFPLPWRKISFVICRNFFSFFLSWLKWKSFHENANMTLDISGFSFFFSKKENRKKIDLHAWERIVKDQGQTIVHCIKFVTFLLIDIYAKCFFYEISLTFFFLCLIDHYLIEYHMMMILNLALNVQDADKITIFLWKQI